MSMREPGGAALSPRSAFAVGVTAALTAGVLGPYLGRNARPWLRATVKLALDVVERTRVRAAELVEDVEDLAAEARREREQPGTASQAG
ncbi:MAG: DUF5132 domain-containing protein [Chloroflexi bacterium]|nr:DUF5132 domain-containing protein [Chloroflexota bacterium]